MKEKSKKRIPLSKKLRFEVFKRDSFTCQYCGRMAPDVILEVDHIVPVAEGGTNDILNLITSCHDCNSGKGKRRLSQNDEVKVQQEQLKQLNKKREQLQMMIQWKKELENFENEQVSIIESIFSEKCCVSFAPIAKKSILKLIKKYGFELVYDSSKISIETYYTEPTKENAGIAFKYIERICFNKKKQEENPILKDINYLVKIAKNRYSYLRVRDLKSFLFKHMEQEDIEDIKSIIKECKSWTSLKESLLYYFDVSEGL